MSDSDTSHINTVIIAFHCHYNLTRLKILTPLRKALRQYTLFPNSANNVAVPEGQHRYSNCTRFTVSLTLPLTHYLLYVYSSSKYTSSNMFQTKNCARILFHSHPSNMHNQSRSAILRCPNTRFGDIHGHTINFFTMQ